MEFEQAITLVALATGPVGIWFGWWLSERSESQRQKRATQEAVEEAERERILGLAAAARVLAGECRSMAHGATMKGGGKSPIGYTEHVEAFNKARDDYQLAILNARMLGPGWIVEPAESIEVLGQEMTQIIGKLQAGAPSPVIRQAEDAIARLDAEVRGLVSKISERYNPDAEELPEHPEVDGVI